MIKKFHKKIFIILLVGIFIIGCSQSSQDLATHNFKQGISEVSFSFLQNAPPREVYQNSDFKIIAQMENKAAYNVHNLDVRLVGFNDRYLQVEEPGQSVGTLNGRSLFAPQGDQVFLEFSGKSFTLFENSQKYSQKYFLKAAYSSTVEFIDTVCINPGFYKVYKTGCEVEQKKSYSGQGAPISISALEEIIYPAGVGADVEFRFEITNRGRGEVKEISLTQAKIGSQQMQCEFTDSANKLMAQMGKDKQKATLICRTFAREPEGYETTIYLNLAYNYEYSESHSLGIIS